MNDIPITTDYKNSLDDIVGSVSFIDSPAGNFARELFFYDPKIYRLEPVVVNHPDTGKPILVGMTLVTNISEGTAGKDGKTD